MKSKLVMCVRACMHALCACMCMCCMCEGKYGCVRVRVRVNVGVGVPGKNYRWREEGMKMNLEIIHCLNTVGYG